MGAPVIAKLFKVIKDVGCAIILPWNMNCVPVQKDNLTSKFLWFSEVPQVGLRKPVEKYEVEKNAFKRKIGEKEISDVNC